MLNPSNRRCEHCAYLKYVGSKRLNNKDNECLKHKEHTDYWKRCPDFMWDRKYMLMNTEKPVRDRDTPICQRCNRPLTDNDSIARGFGLLCYNKRLKKIMEQYKRLF